MITTNFRSIRKIISKMALFSLALGSTAAFALAPGDKAPDFTLKAADGKEYSLASLKGKNVVLEWYNRGCPFVRKHYDDGHMQAMQKKYAAEGVTWLTIISSAKGEQGYADEKLGMEDIKREKMASAALLLDPTGKVGKSYDAKTTPHMYVIDKEGVLVYEGAIDSISSADKADIAKAENYVDQALSAVMAGRKVAQAKTKPYGCSVKYN